MATNGADSGTNEPAGAAATPRFVDLKIHTQLDPPHAIIQIHGFMASSTVRDLKEHVRHAIPSRPSPASLKFIYRGHRVRNDDDTLESILGAQAMLEQTSHTLHMVYQNPQRTSQGGRSTPSAGTASPASRPRSVTPFAGQPHGQQRHILQSGAMPMNAFQMPNGQQPFPNTFPSGSQQQAFYQGPPSQPNLGQPGQVQVQQGLAMGQPPTSMQGGMPQTLPMQDAMQQAAAVQQRMQQYMQAMHQQLHNVQTAQRAPGTADDPQHAQTAVDPIQAEASRAIAPQQQQQPMTQQGIGPNGVSWTFTSHTASTPVPQQGFPPQFAQSVPQPLMFQPFPGMMQPMQPQHPASGPNPTNTVPPFPWLSASHALYTLNEAQERLERSTEGFRRMRVLAEQTIDNRHVRRELMETAARITATIRQRNSIQQTVNEVLSNGPSGGHSAPTAEQVEALKRLNDTFRNVVGRFRRECEDWRRAQSDRSNPAARPTEAPQNATNAYLLSSPNGPYAFVQNSQGAFGNAQSFQPFPSQNMHQPQQWGPPGAISANIMNSQIRSRSLPPRGPSPRPNVPGLDGAQMPMQPGHYAAAPPVQPPQDQHEALLAAMNQQFAELNALMARNSAAQNPTPTTQTNLDSNTTHPPAQVQPQAQNQGNWAPTARAQFTFGIPPAPAHQHRHQHQHQPQPHDAHDAHHPHPQHQGQTNQAPQGRAIAINLTPVLQSLWFFIRMYGLWWILLGGVSPNTRLPLLIVMSIVYWAIQVGVGAEYVAALRGWWDGVVGDVGAARAGAAAGRGREEGGAAGLARGLDQLGEANARVANADAGTTDAAPAAGPGAANVQDEAGNEQRALHPNLQAMRESLRPIEQTVALLFASLWPGVGERHVAERERVRREEAEAEIRRQREVEERRERERRQVEGDGVEAVGEVEGSGEGRSSGVQGQEGQATERRTVAAAAEDANVDRYAGGDW